MELGLMGLKMSLDTAIYLKDNLRLSIIFINLFYNIIMSLYEQFHSDINKTYMYNLITNIIKEKLVIDISLEPSNYQYFLSTLPSIFDNNNVDEIEEMNKFLLTHNVEYFSEKLKVVPKEQIEPIIKDEFEKLLQERENQDILSEQSNPPSENTNEVQERNLNDSNMMLLETLNEESQGQPVPVPDNTNVQVQPVQVPDHTNIQVPDHTNVKIPAVIPEEPTKVMNINSSKRTNINSSRYNYRYDLVKSGILSSELKKISKVLIPIEDNYLFSIPVFILTIPELNCSIHMQQDDIIEGNNRKYGIYKPLEYHSFTINDVKRITIDIRDISEKKYTSNDILKVNIIEFKNNRIYFTCSAIHKLDFQNGDYIKVINNNSHNQLFHIFQEPLKIKKIQDNILVCEYRGFDEIENKTFTNIDMKIMNMSNQNIIYFN